MQLRRLHRRVQSRPAGPRHASRHRTRCRHLPARPHAAIRRTVRDLTRPQPRLWRRSRDAEARHGDVRRALRVVPQPDRRDAQLAAEDGLRRAMTDTTAKPASPAAARTRLMLEGPIVPTLLRLAVPNLVVNVLLIAVTPSVDAHFVGSFGLDALAGLALVFPLMMR